MSRRHLYRKTPDQVAWEAIEGVLSLEEASEQFCAFDWGQSALSYIIKGANVVEQLAYEPPLNDAKRECLKIQVRAFFWNWIENATEPDSDLPQRKTYSL